MISTHELKTWPVHYQAILDGRKGFEMRHDDRGFAEGDHLILREWDPAALTYTGRWGSWLVTYLISHRDGPWLVADHVCMGIRREFTHGDLDSGALTDHVGPG